MLTNPAQWGPQAGSLSTCPRALMKDTVSTGTGILRLSFFQANRSVTYPGIRVRTSSTAAAATPTLCRMGVWSVASNGDLAALVASTPNDTALFSAINTAYAKTFSAPLNLTQGFRYAAGVLVVTAGAAPTMAGVSLPNAAEAGLDERDCANVTGQADLPATVAAASLADTTNHVAFILL